jgi:hypothetical protein
MLLNIYLINRDNNERKIKNILYYNLMANNWSKNLQIIRKIILEAEQKITIKS